MLPDGTVTLFDDGTGLGRPARAVRYSIDTAALTATLLEWENDPADPGTFCCGRARRVGAATGSSAGEAPAPAPAPSRSVSPAVRAVVLGWADRVPHDPAHHGTGHSRPARRRDGRRGRSRGRGPSGAERDPHAVPTVTGREFPPWFFDRADPAPDAAFYRSSRLVTHIDENAIAAVGALYDELDVDGEVLDLMSSWVSHFDRKPRRVTVLGMNDDELRANAHAQARVVHDLNEDPRLPFADDSFDAVVCCVSVDYLVRPVEVFADVARVVRPNRPFVCTFSNRCFPTKAIRGWLHSSDAEHCEIVSEYFRLARAWTEPVTQRRTPADHAGDPLFAVWARRR